MNVTRVPPSTPPDPASSLTVEAVLARQDRNPVWTLPRRYLVIIGIGYFFTFFDIADIGYTMPAIAEQFKLSGSESLFVALALGLVGATSFFLGFLGIGITGLIAGLIALLGPRTSGRRLEEVSR